jgi:hypothetical protein
MTDSQQIDLALEASTSSTGLKRSTTSRKEVDASIRKHTKPSWWSVWNVWINIAVTQKWMDVAAEHIQTDVKDALYDENVQLALVQSLILTMIFPLMFEFAIDWYELAQVGFIGRMTEYYLDYNIFQEANMGFWHDLTIAGYNLGIATLLCGVLGALWQIIVLNQIDEEQAITYTKSLGPMAKKFSFKMLVSGLVLPLMGPFSLRIFATLQTVWGFVMWTFAGPIVAYVLFTLYRSVVALYVCIDEQEAFDPIHLTEEDCMERCREYFKMKPNDYARADYMNCLTFVSKKHFKVPLTYSTQIRALKCFYKCLCEHEDMELDKITLTKFVLEKVDNIPVDHEGQEMELGDEAEAVARKAKQIAQKLGVGKNKSPAKEETYAGEKLQGLGGPVGQAQDKVTTV